MNKLALKTFSAGQIEKAYEVSQMLLMDGKKAPFLDAYCSDFHLNEPLHLLYQDKVIGFASITMAASYGDLWKFYIHPDWRGQEFGLQGAKLVIDYLFEKDGITEVSLEISGGTNDFWARVAASYEDRSFCGLTRCYFVNRHSSILEVHPWVAEYL